MTRLAMDVGYLYFSLLMIWILARLRYFLAAQKGGESQVHILDTIRVHLPAKHLASLGEAE
ncbi:MAG TPA: hypothetical protein DGR15_06445 [Methylophilus sp.]|nr:hypothetical protein [Methylophilus sp.]